MPSRITLSIAALTCVCLCALVAEPAEASTLLEPDRALPWALERGRELAEPASPGVDAPEDDQDGDGVNNRDDNCFWVGNPSQTDTDGDGVGDACDGYPEGGPLSLDPPVALPEPDGDGSTDHYTFDIGTDSQGRVFVLLASYNFVSGQNENLWLTRSEDGGVTWETPIQINAEDGVAWNNYADMAVDDADDIYIIWANLNGKVWLVRSSDGGQSLDSTPLLETADGACPGGGTAVDAHGGRVYAVWDTAANCDDSTIVQRRSEDGGATFLDTQTIRGTGSCIPELDVSQFDETVHLSYSDGDFAASGFVALTTSTDFGASYGAAEAVLDGSPRGDQVFFPAQVEEGQSSVVHIGWAEAARDGTGDFSAFDVWADRSIDGGTTFETDHPVTDNFDRQAPHLQPGTTNWDLVTLPDGSVYRVLLDGNLDTGYRPYYVLSSHGESFSPLEPVDERFPDYTAQPPVIEHTSDGFTVFAYSQLVLGSGDPYRPYFVSTSAPKAGTVGSVIGLTWVDGSKQELAWEAADGALSYDVARGDLSALDAETDLALASGLACDQWVRSVVDDEVPDPGGGYYYLVRGRAGQTRGSWGSQARDQNMTACD